MLSIDRRHVTFYCFSKLWWRIGDYDLPIVLLGVNEIIFGYTALISITIFVIMCNAVNFINFCSLLLV